MARNQIAHSGNRPRRPWVQDTTLYIPPTSSVTEVHLQPEWAALTSRRLEKLLGLKPS